jgi:DNA polymerase-3 subunit epsilon
MGDIVYVAIDFETATSEHSSACAIGLAYGDAFGNLIGSDYSLIKPPGNRYLPRNTSIHNINVRDTENSPYFDEIWTNLVPKIGNAKLLAHFAAFDRNVLYKSLAHYDLPIPENEFVCTLKISRAYPISSSGIHKLDYLMQCLEYNFSHHNAVEDAKACLFLAQQITKIAHQDSIIKLWSDLSSVRKPRKQIVSNDLGTRPATNEELNWPNDFEISKGEFYGKTIVFTGRFESDRGSTMNRTDVTNFAESLGAHVSKSVNNDTDYLVLGTQTNPQLTKMRKISPKHNKVLELQTKGYPIEIIDSKYFIQMAFLTDDDLNI